MEAVARRRILALRDLDPFHFRHDNDSALHSAVRAGAATDRIEAVARNTDKAFRCVAALVK